MEKITNIRDRLAIRIAPKIILHTGDFVQSKQMNLVTGVVVKTIGNHYVFVKWPSGLLQKEYVNDLVKVRKVNE